MSPVLNLNRMGLEEFSIRVSFRETCKNADRNNKRNSLSKICLSGHRKRCETIIIGGVCSK
jgi:hypothetical protein